MSRNHADYSDDELELIAIEADDIGLSLGETPKQRSLQNVLRMLQKLGVDGVPLTGNARPEIVNRVFAASDKLFRKIDKQSGGVHLGLFMFRDFFARLYVPFILGSPAVDFISLVDLSDNQKKWLATDSEAMQTFMDQSMDLFDFAYGFMEFGHTRPVSDRSKELIYRAHVQLEAAAATATAAYDYQGTLQSALLGTELALKAGLSCNGYDDELLRKDIGHDLVAAAKALGSLESSFDTTRIIRSVRTFPKYVQSRYSGVQPDRRQMGHIVMKAQYVASEVTRAFTDRNLRELQEVTLPRSYPD